MGMVRLAAALEKVGNRDFAIRLRLASNPVTAAGVKFSSYEKQLMKENGVSAPSVPLTAGLIFGAGGAFDKLTVWAARNKLRAAGLTNLARKLAGYPPDALIISLGLGPGELDNIRRAMAV